jgi:hypothetical protein
MQDVSYIMEGNILKKKKNWKKKKKKKKGEESLYGNREKSSLRTREIHVVNKSWFCCLKKFSGEQLINFHASSEIWRRF